MQRIFLLLAVCFFAATHASAEVEVAVTLRGDLDEIITLLTQLQALGVGGQSASETPLSVEVQSVSEGAAMTEAGEATEPEPEEPRLAFSNPVLPANAGPGAEVALAIQVVDTDHVVDTVAARIENAAIAIDLFDNGTHGDQTAGDGVWSGLLPLPGDLAPGDYKVIFSAFDALGNPVPLLTEDGQISPLTATARLKVNAP